VADQMGVSGEIRQHLFEPRLDLRIVPVDAAHRAVVDIGVLGEHPVEIVEAASIDRRRVVDEQLLDFQSVRDLGKAQHGSDSTPWPPAPPYRAVVSTGRHRSAGLHNFAPGMFPAGRLGCPVMGRFAGAVALLLIAVLSVVAPGAPVTDPVAWADPEIRPVGSVPAPTGPAQAWIVADLDT